MAGVDRRPAGSQNARKEGCGLFRWKVTSLSPFVVTSSRFAYQDLRGLRRSASPALPASMSQVHFTSLAANGVPSCHLTPWRSGKVNSVPSSFHDQLVARSGMIDSMLFCGTSCLYITRLLKTPIIGRNAANVDSSCSETLAGLSKNGTLRIPPDFCATAGPATNKTASTGPTVANAPRLRFIFVYLPLFLRVRSAANPIASRYRSSQTSSKREPL